MKPARDAILFAVCVSLSCALLVGCERTQPEPESNSVQRARVTFGHIRHGELAAKQDEDAHAVTLDLDGGQQLRIDTFLLVISDVELHACVQESQAPASSLLDLVIPEAHAHVPSSATRLGTPYVEDLLGKAGRASIVGEVAPPAGSYCGLFAIVAPADDDVMNLTEVRTEELEEKSALLAGAWREDDAAEWEPFSHAFSFREAISIELFDPKTGKAPLVLGADDSAFLLVDKELDRERFFGSAGDLREPEAARALVARALRGLKLYRVPGAKAPKEETP